MLSRMSMIDGSVVPGIGCRSRAAFTDARTMRTVSAWTEDWSPTPGRAIGGLSFVAWVPVHTQAPAPTQKISAALAG